MDMPLLALLPTMCPFPPAWFFQVAHVEVLARFYISRHEYSKAAQARRGGECGWPCLLVLGRQECCVQTSC